MADQEKKSAPRGVWVWRKLETVGDVKRFLRWVILALKDKKISPTEANAFTQAGIALIRAAEKELEPKVKELEEMVLALHDRLQSPQSGLQ
jgi:hypothetical protein